MMEKTRGLLGTFFGGDDADTGPFVPSDAVLTESGNTPPLDPVLTEAGNVPAGDFVVLE